MLLASSASVAKPAASSFGKSSVSIGKPTVGGGFRPATVGMVGATTSSASYSVGDKVLHKIFGKGMILKAQKMGNDTLLEIAFEEKGTKTLMANFCKMEKI